MKSLIQALTIAVALTVTFVAQAAPTYYYSLDIGSDLEMSDPNTPGLIDPGDVLLMGELVKDDAMISGTDPAPPRAVPVGAPYQDGIEQGYFDLDGEDQLDVFLENIDGAQPMEPGRGLILNPDNIVYSLDDDQAPGWYSREPYTGDVPINSNPNHGSDRRELVGASGWYSWGPNPGIPVASETDLNLAPDPNPQINDDDVDALDMERRNFWYWSSDHEATYGTDPADIYITDLSGSGAGTRKAIDNTVIGVPNGTDIDAFEFIVTNDPRILENFQLNSGTYLALLFSVDEDDPITQPDESGGLSPSTIYISLLTGATPMALSNRSEDGDVDALTVYQQEIKEIDYGDAPKSYKTLLSDNGARHIIGGPWLGITADNPDGDTDGQPSSDAMGDDNAGNDDENGVTFSNASLIRGIVASCNVVVNGGGGTFKMWIDWNQNGSFEVSEMVANQLLPDGIHVLPVTPPGDAVPGNTFARCRISTETGLDSFGPADNGEVEDHILNVTEGFVDWGILQSPPATTSFVGVASAYIYGQCWHNGLTPPSTNPAPGLIAQLGYGPSASYPPGHPGWSWTTASFHSQTNQPDNDEYRGKLTINTPGTYDYAFRFSLNGIDWIYCDLDTTTNGYTSSQAGVIVVKPVPLDYGDTPSTYPTLFADNGARHVESKIFLGAHLDMELDGQPSAGADGDDLDADGDDEDGILLASQITRGNKMDFAAWIAYSTATGGYLNAWVDLNADGDWDDLYEHALIDEKVNTVGTNSFAMEIPDNATPGETYVRFRYASTPGLDCKGLAEDGEVEDYMITIFQEIPPVKLNITNIMEVASNNTVMIWWNSVSNIVYQMQLNTNLMLAPLSWTNVGAQVVGPLDQQSDTNAISRDRYYRITVPYVTPLPSP